MADEPWPRLLAAPNFRRPILSLEPPLSPNLGLDRYIKDAERPNKACPSGFLAPTRLPVIR